MLHRKRAVTAAALVCASLVVPATGAVAARVVGTANDDVLTGTPVHDRVLGRAGNDAVDALDGPDRVLGGPGDDRLSGGDGNDRLLANAGADVLDGGPGDDRLFALIRVDVDAPGADQVAGGEGNDRVHVRDGEPDVVSCGDGFDVARLDPSDVIADATPVNQNGSCERTIRQAPRPGFTGPEGS